MTQSIAIVNSVLLKIYIYFLQGKLLDPLVPFPFGANPSFPFHAACVSNSGLPALDVQMMSVTAQHLPKPTARTVNELQHKNRQLIFKIPSWHISPFSSSSPEEDPHLRKHCSTRRRKSHTSQEGREQTTVHQDIAHHQLGELIQHKCKRFLSPCREAKTN